MRLNKAEVVQHEVELVNSLIFLMALIPGDIFLETVSIWLSQVIKTEQYRHQEIPMQGLKII